MAVVEAPEARAQGHQGLRQVEKRIERSELREEHEADERG